TNFSLISLQASSLREHITIFAPASANPSAICAPSPLPPPVIIAVFPDKLNRFETTNLSPPSFLKHILLILIWQFDCGAPHRAHQLNEEYESSPNVLQG